MLLHSSNRAFSILQRMKEIAQAPLAFFLSAGLRPPPPCKRGREGINQLVMYETRVHNYQTTCGTECLPSSPRPFSFRLPGGFSCGSQPGPEVSVSLSLSLSLSLYIYIYIHIYIYIYLYITYAYMYNMHTIPVVCANRLYR